MSKLSEITKNLEAAVEAVSTKKAALDKARQAASAAEAEYLAVVDAIRKHHADYQAVMQDILTLGGTIHR